ncbi:MAG: NYN domain-containing protein [Bacteroidetes bacterium]|nr:MAG: NYN domain-containing protein [Bacteroidota bacterium]TAF91531.1 MAG: NYN domain-containing protein [Bacteroidota bacterium]
MKRVTFYFDGFNFYNGLKDKCKSEPTWKNYYWLDLVKFCNSFLSPDHSLVKVKYFTAPPSDDKKRSRQAAFFSANKLLHGNTIEIIQGKYQNKDIRCKLCKGSFTGQEEKRTDVNIAVSMIMDCVLDKTDILVLISADSDQIPTLQTIKSEFSEKKVKVYFPPERNSTDILQISKPIVFLGDNEAKFRNSIMPTIVTDGVKKYTRPETWKHSY